jgi:hypothetical protein
MTRIRSLSLNLAAGILAVAASIGSHTVLAQTTVFTYQGRLTDNNASVTGNHDFQYSLYDASTGGIFYGTITRPNVPVTNGIFTDLVDFGDAPFANGATRYLEIAVRPAGVGMYTPIHPRQQVLSTPYAIQALNSQTLAGTPINRFLISDGSARFGIGTATPGARVDILDNSGLLPLLVTGSARAFTGRVGAVTCGGGQYAVGGCAGISGVAGIRGDSDSGIGGQFSSSTNRAVQGFSGTGIGVIGDSTTRGVVGTLGGGSCAGTYGVGGCGGTSGDGVVGRSATGPGGASFAAFHAYNSAGGDLFIGEIVTFMNFRVARIDGTGRGFFNGGTTNAGADYADSMRTTDDPRKLEPGDVLAIDPKQGFAVRKVREANSRLIAGVYSTKPAVLGVGAHGIDDSLEGEVPVALVGIVPTKVSDENGPIEIGDMLVSASLPGHAMKARPRVVKGTLVYPTGAILGKALEALKRGSGKIKVLVILG